MALPDPRSDGVHLVDLRKWYEDMDLLADEFVSGFEAVHGYPPGEHTVCRVPAGEGPGLVEALARQGVAGPLLEYYGHLGAVELPDLGNGIWIDDASFLIAQVATGNYPNRLTGAIDDTVSVFATDGGGGMYALSHASGCVYHLTAGSLTGNIFELEESGCSIAAEDLGSFLGQMHASLTAAVDAQHAALRAAHGR
ncbi:hypothetical protein [Streptomyces sp. PA03-2a]|uniref:hypothetical protein n=1 Tax=Streptomyces sp. PA03-2a TaxID=3028701 RepID=UPI0029ADAEE0|nr:hypothetical protein [Streptomyces sp. PA03-2a]MDX2733599.1 hypothetical protein [Streptomyces sp. PA03-2a]